MSKLSNKSLCVLISMFACGVFSLMICLFWFFVIPEDEFYTNSVQYLILTIYLFCSYSLVVLSCFLSKFQILEFHVEFEFKSGDV